MSFPAERRVSGTLKLRFGAFEVDLENREIRKHGIRLKLQQKPFQILEVLLHSPGQLVLRQELLERLWPGLHVNFDRSLNTAVNSLRRALGDTSRSPRFIETRAGLGYLFIAPVEQLGPAPRRDRTAAEAPPPQAPEDCLKGRYFCSKLTEEDLHKAVAHFEAALAQNPDCPFAHAGLADAYGLYAVLNMAPRARVYPRAKELAAGAVRLGPELGEAHAALAGVKRLFEWDWAGAEAGFQRALELSPYSAIVRHTYGTHLASLGKAEASLHELRRAQELAPLSPLLSAGAAWSLYVARDFRGAFEECWKILAMEPRFAAAQLILGLAYEQMDMPEEAIVELNNARTCSGNQPAVVAALAHAYARAGRTAEAGATLLELNTLAAGRSVSPYWEALAWIGLGDSHQALESLARAHAERDVWLAWLKVDPRLDPLRAEAEFQELLRGVGLAG